MMSHITLPLYPVGAVPGFDPMIGQDPPSLSPFLLTDGTKHPCVIVCPGGAYAFRSAHEGDTVSEHFNTFRLNAVTLNYRVAPYSYPAMTDDLTRAIRYLRYHADFLGIDPERIAVLGFSAGGHLASTSLYHFDYGIKTEDPIDACSSRPDAVILCYPVVTLDEGTHDGTRDHFLGDFPNCADLIERFSSEKQIRADSPPCFLWHTEEDTLVSVENSRALYRALIKKGITAECHIFPHGPHGLGLATEMPEVAVWPEYVVTFLKRIGFC